MLMILVYSIILHSCYLIIVNFNIKYNLIEKLYDCLDSLGMPCFFITINSIVYLLSILKECLLMVLINKMVSNHIPKINRTHFVFIIHLLNENILIFINGEFFPIVLMVVILIILIILS